MEIEITKEEMQHLLKVLNEKTVKKVLIPRRTNSESKINIKCWSPLMSRKSDKNSGKPDFITIHLKRPCGD